MSTYDAQLEFDDNAAHTSSSTTSTNVIDLSLARKIGVGTPIYIEVVVTAAMTDASSNKTMTVTLETGSALSSGAISSPTTAQTIGTFPALSAIGTKLQVALSPSVNARYAQLRYATSTGSLTTGSFSGYIPTSLDSFTHYTSGRVFS